MSIQKEAILSLATELGSGATEAHWRSAISRAYYAAYHGCNSWHSALPIPGSNAGQNGGIHQQLINRLRNPDSSVPQAERTLSKILAMKLEVLRNQRGLADYSLDETLDKVAANSACELASAILLKL